MIELIPPNHPILDRKAVNICPCHIGSEKTSTLLDELIAMAEQSLSAPQVGLLQRIIVVEGKVYINPEIVWQSEDLVAESEGCLSSPTRAALVSRPTSLIIRAYDRQKKIFTEEVSGKKARRILHAIDHLDGKRL